MEIIHGNENDFNKLISEGTVLVDFYATWCGPCKMLGNVIDEISTDRVDGKIVKIDVDECNLLAKNYGVMSVPTLLLFKDGKLIDQKVGFMAKDELIEWIQNN